MLVTLSGIVTLVRLLHPEKAPPGISSVQPNSISQPEPIGPALSRNSLLLIPIYRLFFTLAGIVICLRLLHAVNAPDPMLITLGGIVASARLVQFLNASWPILTTPCGIVTDERYVEKEKAYSGISCVQPNSILQSDPIGPALFKYLQLYSPASYKLVTHAGSVMCVSSLQPEKAKDPMLVMLSGIIIFVNCLHPEKAPSGILLVQPNSISQPEPIGPALFRNLLSVSPISYMLVTHAGSVIRVSPLHLQKAQSPTLVTLSGIIMLVN